MENARLKTPDTGTLFWYTVWSAGAFAAVLFVVSVVLSLGQGNWIIDQIDRWQPLIVGLLALGAAAYTVRFISAQVDAALAAVQATRDQIALADQHERERIARQHRSVRAELPNALLDLDDYVNACFKILRLAAERIEPGQKIITFENSTPPDVPAPPREATDCLLRFIQTAEETEYDAVALLVEWMQVQNTRLMSVTQKMTGDPTNVINVATLVMCVADAAALKGRVNGAWGYARRKSKTISPVLEFEDLKRIAESKNFHDDDLPGLNAVLESRAKESPDPFHTK